MAPQQMTTFVYHVHQDQLMTITTQRQYANSVIQGLTFQNIPLGHAHFFNVDQVKLTRTETQQHHVKAVKVLG